MLSSIWLYIGGALASIIIGAGAMHYGDSLYYNRQIEHLKTQQATIAQKQAEAAMTQMTTIANNINAAAAAYGETQTSLNGRIAVILKDLKNVQAKTPLAADCRPDAGRLSSLKSAVDASNNSITAERPSR